MLAPGCEEAVLAAAAAEDGPLPRAKEKVLLGAVRQGHHVADAAKNARRLLPLFLA